MIAGEELEYLSSSSRPYEHRTIVQSLVRHLVLIPNERNSRRLKRSASLRDVGTTGNCPTTTCESTGAAGRNFRSVFAGTVSEGPCMRVNQEVCTWSGPNLFYDANQLRTPLRTFTFIAHNSSHAFNSEMLVYRKDFS